MSLQVLIDPIVNLIRERGSEIEPGLAGQIDQSDQEIIEQLGSLVGAVQRLHKGGCLSLGGARISATARCRLEEACTLRDRYF
jgi:hypothetical protein